jgi:hypothetical protein
MAQECFKENNNPIFTLQWVFIVVMPSKTGDDESTEPVTNKLVQHPLAVAVGKSGLD